jgi:hypothetical protein
MYRAYVNKRHDITAANLMTVDRALREKILSLVPVLPHARYSIRIRSSLLSSEKKHQHAHMSALPSEAWVEGIRSAELFLMDFCIEPLDFYVQLHIRGFDKKGRNIMLVACSNDMLYHKLKEELYRIFPGCFFNDKPGALATAKQLDSVTWNPEAD